MTPRRYTRNTPIDLSDDELVLRYTVELESIGDLARQTGKGTGTITDRLLANGVTIRQRGDWNPHKKAAVALTTRGHIGDGESTEEQHEKHLKLVFAANPTGFVCIGSYRRGGAFYDPQNVHAPTIMGLGALWPVMAAKLDERGR